MSVSILAVIATLIYGAFDGMSKSKQALSRVNDRYHQGRSALSRMARELQTAFLSLHRPIGSNLTPGLMTQMTGFIGTDSRPGDRIDFTSFSHRRLKADTHESDQNELSYFISRDPDKRDKLDLVRREAKWIDLEPTKGGAVLVIAEDVESFDVQYLDNLSGEWTDTWDSTQIAAQPDRLPYQVKLTLVIKGTQPDRPITLMTKVSLAMQTPLNFADPQQAQATGSR